MKGGRDGVGKGDWREEGRICRGGGGGGGDMDGRYEGIMKREDPEIRMGEGGGYRKEWRKRVMWGRM